MTMFPMENIKNLFWLKLNGQQTFCIDLDPHHEGEEAAAAKPKNHEADQEEEPLDISDIVSALNQNPSILRSILSSSTGRIQDLQLKQLLMPTNPKDEKNKGLDSSSSFTPTHGPPPLGNYQKGESSTTVCVICNNTSVDVRGGGEFVIISECGHRYCKDCFVTHLIKKIQEDVFNVKCPISNCKTKFSPKEARSLLPEQVFERWNECLTLSAVLAEPIYIYCPFEWCGKRFVDDERGFLIRACPNCWRLFCIQCKVDWHWHMGKTCAQYKFEVELERRPRRQRRRGGGGECWDLGDRMIIFINDE